VKRLPWWLIGGAVLTFVVLTVLAIVLDRSSLGTGVLVGWGAAIGMWIREGNLAAAQDEPASGEALAAHRRSEPYVAVFEVLLFVGVGLALPYVIQFGQREDDPTGATLALVGAGLVVASALYVAVLALRKSIRTRRADRKTSPPP
jgi:hypothetical protein